jgi:beta-glucosidase/6-phospho-beta-glucosidase/beta-galactosidase
VDSLHTTRHTEHFRQDLRLVQRAGVRSLRYPAPWHSIEARRGEYRWDWMDEAMGALRELGLDPIVDLVHHTSFPDWLEGGFSNPELPRAELEFAQAFAERYPWASRYTVFNEPWLTTFMCGFQGVWPPHGRSPEVFVPMLLNVGRAICEVSAMLNRTVRGLELIHVETCEHHKALDAESEVFAEMLNERRFLMHDLVLGRMHEGHLLYPYLSAHGMTSEDVAWFAEHRARIDVLGLDYYSHSEYQFHKHGAIVPSGEPRGFAAVARDYIDRYGLPVMLSETNVRGYVFDRISWLKYIVEQCEQLVADGVDFRGLCWFPFIDSTDWDSLLQHARGHVDPVGIYWLDGKREARYPSLLSRYFGQLARGELRAADLPAYEFQPPLDEQLRGFLPQMAHWEWQVPLAAGRRTA